MVQNRPIRRRLGLALATSGAFALLVAACSPGVADSDAACDAAFAQAMAIDPASDTVDGFDGAIAGCSSLETWVAAARRFPDTTAGQDPVAFAATRCTASSDLAGSAVCIGLPAQ